MTNHTATVEALTAEVRVLMIGSRQVTMSVYGQLDHVEYGEIEPFGRVMPKDAQPGMVYIIGKRAGSGDLVSSWLPCTEKAIAGHVAARSSAGLCESSAEKEDRNAERCVVTAVALEKAAAELLGDGYIYANSRLEIKGGCWGAAHCDASAASHDQEAEAQERRASLAEDELTRLQALATAAHSRHAAAEARRDGDESRAEAAALETRAQDYRTRAAAHQAEAGELWAALSGCTERDGQLRTAITEAAAVWSGLPLIVLAGLR